MTHVLYVLYELYELIKCAAVEVLSCCALGARYIVPGRLNNNFSTPQPWCGRCSTELYLMVIVIFAVIFPHYTMIKLIKLRKSSYEYFDCNTVII